MAFLFLPTMMLASLDLSIEALRLLFNLDKTTAKPRGPTVIIME